MMDKAYPTPQTPPPPKKKIVPLNFRHALFSLLDFLNSEDRADTFYWNIGHELPLYTA